jgi:ribosomal protein S18 acetylase RimI-like enzyme
MTVVVKVAGVKEAAVVALLGRITFTETFGHLFVEHRDDLSKYLEATFNVPKIEHSLGASENAYWLAFNNDLPVGFAKLKYPSPIGSIQQDDVAQLQKIYVLRDFIGKGIGKPLLHAVLGRAEVKASAVWLAVLRTNERAIRFYETRGFLPLGGDTYTIGKQTFDFQLMALQHVRRAG